MEPIFISDVGEFANKIRRIERKLDFGSIGESGGIDGEFAAAPWKCLMEYLSQFKSIFDKQSFGVDCGKKLLTLT
jgi:hypothetical protein